MAAAGERLHVRDFDRKQISSEALGGVNDGGEEREKKRFFIINLLEWLEFASHGRRLQH